MRHLIVNADDLGWSAAVTGGIIRASREGILTSATVMANAPEASETHGSPSRSVRQLHGRGDRL